jgi:hypothetical protein
MTLDLLQNEEQISFDFLSKEEEGNETKGFLVYWYSEIAA